MQNHFFFLSFIFNFFNSLSALFGILNKPAHVYISQ